MWWNIVQYVCQYTLKGLNEETKRIKEKKKNKKKTKNVQAKL